MAALPYMQLYVAEYLADTTHLNAEEHGAYLLLLMNYWQRGKALLDDNERLANVARVLNERWPRVRKALEEFFEVVDGYWIHHRVERDLEAVRSKCKKASDAGKASAEAKANKKSTNVERTLNERSGNVATNSQPEVNHTDTDTDTDTEQINTLVETDEELPLIPEVKSSPNQEALEFVFQHYVNTLKRDPVRYTLTPKRSAKGTLCLKHCLKLSQGNMQRAVDMMCDAVDGLTKNNWLMGKDPKNTRQYVEWEEHVFRDVETMEKRWDDFRKKAS